MGSPTADSHSEGVAPLCSSRRVCVSPRCRGERIACDEESACEASDTRVVVAAAGRSGDSATGDSAGEGGAVEKAGGSGGGLLSRFPFDDRRAAAFGTVSEAARRPREGASLEKKESIQEIRFECCYIQYRNEIGVLLYAISYVLQRSALAEAKKRDWCATTSCSE